MNYEFMASVGNVPTTTQTIQTTWAGDAFGAQCPSPGQTANVHIFVGDVPDCTWSIAGVFDRACPTDGVVHTVSVEVNGVEVSSQPWPADVPSVNWLFNGSDEDGAMVVVKLDGQAVQTREVVCVGDPPPSNDWLTGAATIGEECEPDPTPTPTVTPTPIPTPTPPTAAPTPTPWSSAASTPPPNLAPPQPAPTAGVSAIQGDVRVINPQDIYKPITDALENIQKGGGATGANNMPSHETADFDDRGKIDEIQGQVDEAMQGVNDIKDSGTEKISSLRDSFTTLETSLGSVSSIDLGLSSFNGLGGFTGLGVIQLGPYQNMIGMCRLIQFWILTIFFGFMTVRALTHTQ